MRKRSLVGGMLLVLVASGCTDSGPEQPARVSQDRPTPTATPTPPPPHPVSLPALMQREYDGRGLRLRRELASTDAYRQHNVTYRSGKLRISGVLNVPRGPGPHPAVVLAHGYIDPDIYVNGQGMRRELDWLARRGFVTLHVDYRNHAGSDNDPKADANLRLGYTEDVINAVHALRAWDGPVDDERVGLAGRSMGGGVIYNVLTVRPAWSTRRSCSRRSAPTPWTTSSAGSAPTRAATDLARRIIRRARRSREEPGVLARRQPALVLRPRHRADPHPPRDVRRQLPDPLDPPHGEGPGRCRRGRQAGGLPGRGARLRAAVAASDGAHHSVPAPPALLTARASVCGRPARQPPVHPSRRAGDPADDIRPGAPLLRRDATQLQAGTSPGTVIDDRPGLRPFRRSSTAPVMSNSCASSYRRRFPSSTTTSTTYSAHCSPCGAPRSVGRRNCCTALFRFGQSRHRERGRSLRRGFRPAW